MAEVRFTMDCNTILGDPVCILLEALGGQNVIFSIATPRTPKGKADAPGTAVAISRSALQKLQACIEEVLSTHNA